MAANSKLAQFFVKKLWGLWMMKDNIQIHLDGSRIQQALWIADKVQSEMAKENLTDL